jgi:hypothetical protein
LIFPILLNFSQTGTDFAITHLTIKRLSDLNKDRIRILTAIEICKTCIHLSNCSRQYKYNQPIVYCDRYEGNRSSFYKEKYINELKGLCQTCENRFICILHKPQGGVWHCDNYL